MSREILPVTEEGKYKGIQHVNVDKTVERIKQELVEKEKVELVTTQSEINRVGMVIKRVEEDLKCRIVSMKTEYKAVTEKDGEKER